MVWKYLASVVFGLGLAAVGWGAAVPTEADDKTEEKKGDKKDGHEHGAGPHGGALFDFGKHVAEFAVDHKKKEATVYIFGADEKTAAPVNAAKLVLSIRNAGPKFEVELLPLDADKDGKASRFVGKHDGLVREQEFAGTLTGVIDGKPYRGDFEAKPEPKKN